MIMANPEFPKVRACLFDMDGLILDTEDIYTKCNNFILQEHGRPNLPWKIKSQMQGRPAPEAADILHAWAELPIPRYEFTAKQAALQAQYFPTARPLPGIPLLLKNLKNSDNVHLALATSSHTRSFKLKTVYNGGLFTAFPEKQRVLGDDPSILPGRGKPAPDIFLLALETINIEMRAKGEKEILPSECLVFEDSVPGVKAGRSAGMRVVWCPHPMALREYRGHEAEVLAGVCHASTDDEFEDDFIEEFGAKGGVLASSEDGRAVLVKSLEDFDYARFGIEI